MSRQTFKHTLFLAGMLIASAAFADPELVRCVDSDGHVTLTDVSCQERGEVVQETAPVSEPGSAASGVAADATAHRTIARPRPLAAPAGMRQTEWVKKALPARSVSPDVETLKTARLNMQAQDNASAALRQQRLAGLN